MSVSPLTAIVCLGNRAPPLANPVPQNSQLESCQIRADNYSNEHVENIFKLHRFQKNCTPMGHVTHFCLVSAQINITRKTIEHQRELVHVLSPDSKFKWTVKLVKKETNGELVTPLIKKSWCCHSLWWIIGHTICEYVK